MKIWLVAGAMSGVGKTTLVERLIKVLTDSEFLKIGHGRRRKKGPENYFTSTDDGLAFIESLRGRCEHCVVESNRLVGRLDADIVIFLDGSTGDRRPDADNLRKSANIIIGRNSNASKWRPALKKLKLTGATGDKVIDIFKAQSEFLREQKMTIRTKIWFGVEQKVVFGEGLARLLQGIDTHGSLTMAAKDEGISYRHAWGNIKEAEERLGFKLLDRQTGGKSGGGSQLTKKGRRLLDGYGHLKRRIIRESNKWFIELTEELSRVDEG